MASSNTENHEKSSKELSESYQSARSDINRLVNELTKENLSETSKKLLEMDIDRGRWPLCESLMAAPLEIPKCNHINVYAALAAIINSKVPNFGELFIKWLLTNLEKGIPERNKVTSYISGVFLSNLYNLNMISGGMIEQIVTMLIGSATYSEEAMEVLLVLLKQVGHKLTQEHPHRIRSILDLLSETHSSKKLYLSADISVCVSDLFRRVDEGFEELEYHSIIDELDLLKKEDQYTHNISLDFLNNPSDHVEENLNSFQFDPEFLMENSKESHDTDEVETLVFFSGDRKEVGGKIEVPVVHPDQTFDSLTQWYMQKRRDLGRTENTSFKFMFQDIKILKQDTPKSLGMINYDFVQVSELNSLEFVCNNGVVSTRLAYYSHTFGDLKKSFMEELMTNSHGQDQVYSIRCRFKGKEIKDDDTPIDLGMKNFDKVDVEIVYLDAVLKELNSNDNTNSLSAQKRKKKRKKKPLRNDPEKVLDETKDQKEIPEPENHDVKANEQSGEQDDHDKEIHPNVNSALEKVLKNFKCLESQKLQLEEKLSLLEEQEKKHDAQVTESINSHAKQMKDYLVKIGEAQDEKASHLKEIDVLKSKLKELEQKVGECDITIKKTEDKKSRFETFMKKEMDRMKAEKESLKTEKQSLSDELKKSVEAIERLEGNNSSSPPELQPKSKEDSEMVNFIRKQIKEREASLECPVCFETASAPIFACPEMHLICSSCCPKLKECPECREKYQNPPRRHRFREETAAELEKLKNELQQLLTLNDNEI